VRHVTITSSTNRVSFSITNVILQLHGYYSFVHSFIHSFIRSFIHSFIHSFTYILFRSVLHFFCVLVIDIFCSNRRNPGTATLFSVDFHPFNGYHFIVGSSFGDVRLYDLRKINKPNPGTSYLNIFRNYNIALPHQYAFYRRITFKKKKERNKDMR